MEKESNKVRDKMMRRGKSIRDKATAAAARRKEEYLGARVPKALREKIIQRADELGIPVSILIRNILEQSLDGPDLGVATESRASGPPAGAIAGWKGANRFPNVLGWEEMLLNKSVNCAACGTSLKPGTSITLGLAGPGEEHVVLCLRCKHVTQVSG